MSRGGFGLLALSTLGLGLVGPSAQARPESSLPAVLRAACPTGRKVRVEMRGLPSSPGSFGASQLEVIFRQIFKDARTHDMRFPRDDVKVSPPATAFARGAWLHRLAGGLETTETLTLTLRAEGDDWRIQEIRSAR